MKRSLMPVIVFLAMSACQSTPSSPDTGSSAGDNSTPPALRDGSGTQGGANAEQSPVQSTVSDKQRILSPSVASAGVAAQADGSNQFTLSLYQQLSTSEKDQNLFFSPYSISSALAMTWAGARGVTETEMATALGFVLDQTKLHPFFNYLDLELAKRGQGAAGKDGKGFRLRIANALWGQQGYSFLPSFLDLLAENYGAGLSLLDFGKDPAGAADAINGWIAKKTEDLIKKLVDASSFDDTTRLVLTNTIYFNAAWQAKFKKEETQNRTFKLLSGSSIQVPQMAQQGSFKVLKNDQLQAIELPYDGQEISMVILCPAEGKLADFEKALTWPKLKENLASLQSNSVQLVMPKWRFESPILSLTSPLTNLGMRKAFTPDADFSGMDGTHSLFVGDVLHKAVVIVDEEGTEAAAATAVIIGTTSVPIPPAIQIVLDHPFLYLIRDIPTGTILFAGKMLDPR